MLHTSSVEPNTLSLLKELLAIPVLESYALVGGTALSLQYGHRISVDLDLFTTEKLAYNEVLKVLEEYFGNRLSYEGNFSNFGIFCFIDNVKVDIVHYPHQRIAPLIIDDDIRMYDSKDISVMKIQAILGRGKKKDFFDMAELLQHYTLAEIIDNHSKKYPNQMLLISIPQELIYFTDAEESEDPVSLKNQTWESVRQNLQRYVREFLS